MKKIPILMLIFLFYTSFSFAQPKTEYNGTGSTGGKFGTGNSIFNSQFTNQFGEPDIFAAAITSRQRHPYVSDLDRDGINEIIIVDDDTIKLYHNKQLNLIDSYDTAFDSISNLEIFDIDGNDNLTEIVFEARALPSSFHEIYILEYNGTSLRNQTTFRSSTIAVSGETLIKCGKVNECIAYSGATKAFTTAIASLVGFNSTSANTANRLTISGSSCLPKIPEIQYEDFDSDGTKEYVLSTAKHSSGNIRLTYASITSNLSVQQDRDVSVGTVATAFLSACDASGASEPMARYFSSPLVADFITGGTLETIIAYSSVFNTYILEIWGATGPSRIDRHPEIQTADGNIISNPIKYNAFPVDKSMVSDKQNDYCVLGFRDTGQILDLLCGSQVNTYHTFETIEYLGSYSGFNISNAHNNYQAMSHSHKSDTTTINGNNLDELLNSYGVWTLDDETCDVAGCIAGGGCTLNNLCELEWSWINPQTSSVLISVDASKETLEDMIALTSANLFYMDDEYQNSAPEITEYTINPCLNSVWKQNTTVQVSIKATDPDNDNIFYGIVGYKGDSNEQSSNSSPVGSGIEVTQSFIANKTVGSGTLQLQARDIFNNITNVDIIDVTFSVASNGVSLNDCETVVDVSAEEEEQNVTENVVTAISPTNPVTRGTNVLAETFGLSSSLIWILLMIIIAGAVWYYSKDKDALANFIIIGFIEIGLMILGIKLGMLSSGLIFTFSILGIIAIILYVRRKIFSSPLER